MDRRVFLKGSFLTASVLVFSGNEIFAQVSPLDTLEVLCDDLFPLSKTLDANSSWYIEHVILNHSKIEKKHKQFLRNGVKWLNEETLKLYGKLYIELMPKQRQKALEVISKTHWGESFIYVMLKYIMESLLGDPIYKINKNQQGWEWAEHKSGYPRPKEAFL